MLGRHDLLTYGSEEDSNPPGLEPGDTGGGTRVPDAVKQMDTLTTVLRSFWSETGCGNRSLQRSKPGAQTVKALVPLTPGSYELHDVPADTRIDDFVRLKNRKFFVGKGYYTFTKTETIQKGKELVVVERATGIAYGGAGVRQMLGLPTDVDVRVKPDANPDYLICVQSTANNRKLLKGTKLLWTF